MNESFWGLVAYSAFLSLLAVGGLNTVLPEFFRYVVVEHQLLTAAELSSYVGLAQAAPGPNFLLVTLVGYHFGGFPGAVALTLAFCVPPTLLAYFTVGLGKRTGNAPWKRVLMTGLGPLTLGLIFASGYVVTLAAPAGTLGYALTLLAALAVVATRVNPLWVLAVAGVIGAFFVQA